jgi:hypothetical protein
MNPDFWGRVNQLSLESSRAREAATGRRLFFLVCFFFAGLAGGGRLVRVISLSKIDQRLP